LLKSCGIQRTTPSGSLRPSTPNTFAYGAAIASGSGTGRPVARSIQTIFAAPSAYFLPFIQIS
jgi:hypothetical protein